jgi:hypothetical protein
VVSDLKANCRVYRRAAIERAVFAASFYRACPLAGFQRLGRGTVAYHGVVSPLGNFVHSFGAARQFLIRAYETGSLIEAMVLYVSLIDGFLRIALVLDKQLAGDLLGDIDAYVQQAPGGAKFTERAIYTETHTRGLIDDAVKAEITDLYEQRNAIIHRFFLTDLKYADLGPLLNRYEVPYEQCAAIVEQLELRQVHEGKGMTVEGPKADREEVDRAVKAKLGFQPRHIQGAG